MKKGIKRKEVKVAGNSDYFKPSQILAHNEKKRIIYLKPGITGERHQEEKHLGPVVNHISADSQQAWMY